MQRNDLMRGDIKDIAARDAYNQFVQAEMKANAGASNLTIDIFKTNSTQILGTVLQTSTDLAKDYLGL